MAGSGFDLGIVSRTFVSMYRDYDTTGTFCDNEPDHYNL